MQSTTKWETSKNEADGDCSQLRVQIQIRAQFGGVVSAIVPKCGFSARMCHTPHATVTHVSSVEIDVRIIQ